MNARRFSAGVDGARVQPELRTTWLHPLSFTSVFNLLTAVETSLALPWRRTANGPHAGRGVFSPLRAWYTISREFIFRLSG
jgi:hypothetical protein